MASVYRRATDECAVSTTGHWGSGSIALTISLRRCRATAYTSSAVPRFTDMLLSLRPFGFRLVVHLGVLALSSGQLRWQFSQCVTRRTVLPHTALRQVSSVSVQSHIEAPFPVVGTAHTPRTGLAGSRVSRVGVSKTPKRRSFWALAARYSPLCSTRTLFIVYIAFRQSRSSSYAKDFP
jgi:hypothetical protein